MTPRDVVGAGLAGLLGLGVLLMLSIGLVLGAADVLVNIGIRL